MKKLQALVLGASGATGQVLVKLLLEDSNFSKVSVFTRKTLTVEHQKLEKHKIDFSELEKYKSLITGDILFSAFGTTRKDAGSKDQQYLIDYTYQFEFAKMASENGVQHYALVSSTGANDKSFFFYPKIKGALEKSIKMLPFKTIQIFQPPTLIRQPELLRAVEKSAIKIFNRLNRIGLFKSQKPLYVGDLAKKMIFEALSENRESITTYNRKNKNI
ncbi:NAD(P)H-binding protein [Flavobacteriaceae bacterium]|nr:NAD(P)H-binding protein [Flavobacteriaceae bacterium]